MKFVVDHDLHIHSQLSACSRDPEQTCERLLRYAQEYGLSTICVTNHFWDDKVEGGHEWYKHQNYAHLSKAKPLPQAEGVRFLFGCETELNNRFTLGIAKETCDCFDFIAIPTTHFHFTNFTVDLDDMKDAESRANVWIKRLDAVLAMDLPFHKVGIAHLTCNKIADDNDERTATLNAIPTEELQRLFSKAAALGVGIEINIDRNELETGHRDATLRVYRTAKECGCQFYCGSDTHRAADLGRKIAIYREAVDMLGLTEEDKFVVGRV